VPAEEAGQSHQNAQNGGHHRQPEQPALVRDGRDRQERDGNGAERVRQVELIVTVIERVVGLFVLLGLALDFALLLRLLLGQGLMTPDRFW